MNTLVVTNFSKTPHQPEGHRKTWLPSFVFSCDYLQICLGIHPTKLSGVTTRIPIIWECPLSNHRCKTCLNLFPANFHFYSLNKLKLSDTHKPLGHGGSKSTGWLLVLCKKICIDKAESGVLSQIGTKYILRSQRLTCPHPGAVHWKGLSSLILRNSWYVTLKWIITRHKYERWYVWLSDRQVCLSEFCLSKKRSYQ